MVSFHEVADVVFSNKYLRCRQQSSHQAHPHTQCLALYWVSKTGTGGLTQTHTGPLKQGHHEVHHLEEMTNRNMDINHSHKET